MRNLLTKHGIPTTNLAAAVEFLNEAPESTANAFAAEFGLKMTGNEALTAARFAADAIFRGAGAVDKVVGYVAKRMTGMPASAAPVAPVRVVMVGQPVVDNESVTIAPVVVEAGTPTTAPTVKVKGKPGRKRLGNSDFCKAVAAIEASKSKDRQALLDCIVAAGIKQTSAVVYLWRYNKGERE